MQLSFKDNCVLSLLAVTFQMQKCFRAKFVTVLELVPLGRNILNPLQSPRFWIATDGHRILTTSTVSTAILRLKYFASKRWKSPTNISWEFVGPQSASFALRKNARVVEYSPTSKNTRIRKYLEELFQKKRMVSSENMVVSPTNITGNFSTTAAPTNGTCELAVFLPLLREWNIMWMCCV